MKKYLTVTVCALSAMAVFTACSMSGDGKNDGKVELSEPAATSAPRETERESRTTTERTTTTSRTTTRRGDDSSERRTTTTRVTTSSPAQSYDRDDSDPSVGNRVENGINDIIDGGEDIIDDTLDTGRDIVDDVF
ncbi:MAG: hypothetical protein IJ806_04265 [Ruminococcus sp.]|nr:hypothetical protein [Ruminococcus sp.]